MKNVLFILIATLFLAASCTDNGAEATATETTSINGNSVVFQDGKYWVVDANSNMANIPTDSAEKAEQIAKLFTFMEIANGEADVYEFASR